MSGTYALEPGTPKRRIPRAQSEQREEEHEEKNTDYRLRALRKGPGKRFLGGSEQAGGHHRGL